MDKTHSSKKWSDFDIILIIVILGLVIYCNSFFNGFFADDYHQIVDNPTVHSLSNIPNFFRASTFYTGNESLSGNYYKPILPSIYAILYAIFGTNAAGYHIFQVIIHIFNSILIYVFFKRYFEKVIAAICAIIFLTHPINNESVVYIANLQDSLFLFFGLAALVINKSEVQFRQLYVGLLLLLSLLSKETGGLFLILVPLSTILSDKKGWVKDLFISLIVFGIYCLMRFLVAQIYFNHITTAPIMLLSINERLLHIPAILLFYFKTFLFPKDLLIFQTYTIKSSTLSNFYIPLLVDFIIFGLIILASLFIFRSHKSYRQYLFFLIWFLIGLFLHLQIFPLDGTVADRWFYFPIIGLLGMLATVAITISENYDFFTKWRKILVILLIALISVYSVRVIIRNSNWKDQSTLLTHDIQFNKESYQLEEGLGLELMKQNRLEEAYPHLLRSTEIFPGVNNLTSLGVYYSKANQYEKAKQTFEKAMQYDDLLLTYENYAITLLLTQDINKLEVFSKNAVNKFPQSYKLWLYLAISSYALHHDDEALQYAINSHNLNPRRTSEYVISAIKNKQPIDASQL